MPTRDDPRNIRMGWEIPSEFYADQPYLVKAADGAWVCVMTTGAGHEGASGQHVVTRRSTDRGQTWPEACDVEPADGPEASYAILLAAPSGRLFCFYNHNTDNLRAVRADPAVYPDGLCRRVDSLGHFVFRYSDDHGRSWSPARYEIPQRVMEIDRQNAYGGDLLFFWNVGKPFVLDGAAYVSLHKVGGFGAGFFTRSEGVLLHSPDLLSLEDPGAAHWETLPEGDVGLRTPPGGGPIAEEQSYVVLSDGSIYAVYRTVDGHPACCLSRDGGRTWSAPAYQRFAHGAGESRVMKHPRAANFVWTYGPGRYLYWFHNHGGRFIREAHDASLPYNDRNPAWICGGVEVQTPSGPTIAWSQPEILLYDDDPYVRISYPDLLLDDGIAYVSETQKETARVHAIDSALLEGLFGQFATPPPPPPDDALLSWEGAGPAALPLPELPPFTARDPQRGDFGTLDRRAGFSIELGGPLGHAAPGATLLSNRDAAGRGFAVIRTADSTLELILHDGRTECRWAADPGLLRPGQQHHAVAIVDGGPKLILWVIDGHLCDGGDVRQFGWGRYNPHWRGPSGAPEIRIAAPGVTRTALYGRALRVSEAIARYRHHSSSKQGRV
ncbi:MAG: sialidase family protein [Anaerolineae bacterium]